MADSRCVEPIDHRVTAARLLSLRAEANADRKIAEVLGVRGMGTFEAVRTKEEIDEFLASGDATKASQLIHAAGVRKGATHRR